MSAGSTGNHLITGADYFIQGLRLLTHPKLRKYILVPLLVNCVLFAVLTGYLVSHFDTFTQIDLLPEWLDFLEKALKWVIWFLLAVMIIFAYGYSFNILTQFFAAPFYGLLAQRTEELISGHAPPDESLLRMIPRTLFREISKLFYFLSRGILVLLLMLLLGTIPGLNLLVPVIGVLWGAWSMALQYSDYAADNHHSEFSLLRKKLRHCKYSSTGFGSLIMVSSMIPLVNIIASPAAVIGGTIYWVEELESLKKST